jgi:hypothetical protein
MVATLAQVTLQKKSGIPADAVQNNFVFDPPALDSAGQLLCFSAITDFYNTTGALSGDKVATWLGSSVSRAVDGVTVKLYDISAHLNGSAHGSPVAISHFTLAAGVGDGLPDEVACALSFHSAYGSDAEFAPGSRPRSRDRGRVYIGPLTDQAIHVNTTTNEIMLVQALRTTVAEAANRLKGMSANWSVWSRRRAAIAPVVAGWVDDRFDSQRRRGDAATARSMFDSSGVTP